MKKISWPTMLAVIVLVGIGLALSFYRESTDKNYWLVVGERKLYQNESSSQYGKVLAPAKCWVTKEHETVEVKCNVWSKANSYEITDVKSDTVIDTGNRTHHFFLGVGKKIIIAYDENMKEISRHKLEIIKI